MTALSALEVLVLDCQASGATPAHGDLLACGWAFCSAQGVSPIRDHWVRPRTSRGISRPVRELTGWSDACLELAQEEQTVWRLLREELRQRLGEALLAPTVIHFARFELGFLRELQARLEPERPFPLDVRCLHAIGARLFPDLPRRNIRALAGFLGHTTDLTRHVAGHVEATAFIWRALLPQLAEHGVTTWSELHSWLADAPKPARRSKRVYPLSVERRRALPDRPGVYRFVRKNESVLYVGKAASLKRRVAGHFSSRGPRTERGLELLSQVHAVRYTETPSILEAALLETDEIKRIEPPYNVQLRGALRQAWFAARDFRRASAQPDAEHTIGPLPSQAALLGLFAWRVLLDELSEDTQPSPALCAMVLAVPAALLPPTELFCQGFHACVGEHFAHVPGSAAQRVTRVARALWLERGRSERDSSPEDAPPDRWDLARVRRRLERTLVGAGLLLRRARLLRLLADCTVGYRERGMARARVLVIGRAEIVERLDLPLADHEALSLAGVAARRPLPLGERRRCFNAASYDRLRVLMTELRRVEQEGGQLGLRIGRHHFNHPQVLRLLRAV